MSGTSERANGQASGPVHTSRFLGVLNHGAFESPEKIEKRKTSEKKEENKLRKKKRQLFRGPGVKKEVFIALSAPLYIPGASQLVCAWLNACVPLSLSMCALFVCIYLLLLLLPFHVKITVQLVHFLTQCRLNSHTQPV